MGARDDALAELQSQISFRNKISEIIKSRSEQRDEVTLTRCQLNGSIIDVLLITLMNELNERSTSVSDLVFQIGVPKATVARALKKLEKLRLAVRYRDGKDQRRTFVSICPIFSKQLQKILRHTSSIKVGYI